MTMKRAVGYCSNKACLDWNKGKFLLNPSQIWLCGRCQEAGKLQPEEGRAQNTQTLFKEVRVRYNFDPYLGHYDTTAVVRDESLWGRHNVYHYDSPMICTQKHALRVAEQILAVLNQHPELLHGEELPSRIAETRLHWDEDRETFKQKCGQWGQSLGGLAVSPRE